MMRSDATPTGSRYTAVSRGHLVVYCPVVPQPWLGCRIVTQADKGTICAFCADELGVSVSYRARIESDACIMPGTIRALKNLIPTAAFNST